MNFDTYMQYLDTVQVPNFMSDRIIENLTARKQKKLNVSHFAGLAATACAVVISVLFGYWALNTPPTLPPVILPSHSENKPTDYYPSSKSTDSAASTAPTNHSPKTSTPTTQSPLTSSLPTQTVSPTYKGAYWNTVSIGASTLMYRDPNAKSTEMYFNDYVKYIGFDPTPSYVPSGYTRSKEVAKQAIYFEPDGSPSDYYSHFTFSYKNGENRIIIKVGKVKVYAHDDVPYTGELRSSKLNEFETTLLKNVNFPNIFVLSANFRINNLNYYAYTRGAVDETEFLKVIESLLKS